MNRVRCDEWGQSESVSTIRAYVLPSAKDTEHGNPIPVRYLCGGCQSLYPRSKQYRPTGMS